MLKRYYAVYDVKAGLYGAPFIEVSDGTAIRAIQDVIASNDHPFAKHPADFSLHFLGIWNDRTGEIEGQKPEKLQELTSLVVE